MVMKMKCKRSRNIDLSRMFKHSLFPASALAVAVMFSGCGDGGEDGYLYRSVDECIQAHPGKEEICRAAFEEAQYGASESGPRYGTEQLCEVEFGPDQCRLDEGGNFWTPFIGGYVVGDEIDEVDDFDDYKKKRKKYRYAAAPVFLSTRGGSAFYGLNEQKIGKPGQRKVGISGSAYERRTAKMYTRTTVRRGGFGSTVRTSSGSGGRSWGG